MFDFEKEEEIEEQEENKKNNEPENKKTLKEEIISSVVFFLVVLGIAILLIQFVGQRTTVSGSSMENTLSDGDSLIVDKISYRFKDPSRYDIIIFPYENQKDTYYIKRIIGMPGETIRIDETGTIFINDEILYENYGLAVIVSPGIASEPITLAEDEYFVMGDNRNNSRDSRMEDVGPIHRDRIVGRAWVRIYPFNKMEVLKHAKT